MIRNVTCRHRLKIYVQLSKAVRAVCRKQSVTAVQYNPNHMTLELRTRRYMTSSGTTFLAKHQALSTYIDFSKNINYTVDHEI